MPRPVSPLSRPALAFALAAGAAFAANPIVANAGQADPHVHYWPETNAYFAYATHDYSPNNTGFRMDDWWVWSSSDLRTWQLADVLYPNATPSPPGDWESCWASTPKLRPPPPQGPHTPHTHTHTHAITTITDPFPTCHRNRVLHAPTLTSHTHTHAQATDGAHKKNVATGAFEYFFYMSIGTCQTAVMKSTVSPAGPWVNVLGAPLLNSSLGNSLNPKACFRDPAVFEDDDGSHYIISGVFDYYIMRLGDDLTSLAEMPRLVTINNPTGPYGAKTDDKPFLHKANGLYYLSWGCFYGTATSVYGPYTYVGSAIDTDFISPAFRTNNTGGAWYEHEDYADRHGSFFTNSGGQAFYASNDRSHSTDVNNRGVFRDTVIGYVHYFANNSIAAVVIDGTGVGEYRAAHIEAENFMRMSGVARKRHLPERGDAFVVAFGAGAGGGELHFPHVLGAGGPVAALSLVAANGGGAPVEVVARRGAAAGGAELARFSVAPSGGAFARTTCVLVLGRGDADDLDLVLAVQAAAGDGQLELLIDSLAVTSV